MTLHAAFEFATATRIIFGARQSEQLPSLVASYGHRVLIVTGGNAGRFGPLRERLRQAVEVTESFSVAEEPTVSLVEAGTRIARTLECDVVVAIGGGSVIDAGKAIAALANNPGNPLDYLEVVGRGQALSHPSLPFIAVPTTAGTGAEVTRNAVLAVPDARVKVSLRSPHMLPKIALVDPTLSIDLPSNLTATTGMDALTQLIEPYLSCRANPLTDALCRDAIPRAARALPRVVRQPDDLEARTEMALASLCGGLALANAGLGAVHGFAGPIGGMFPAPHGAVCATLLPHVLRANHEALVSREPSHHAIDRIHEIGQWLTGRADANAADAVAWCAEIATTLPIPRLASWGIKSADVSEIVQRARNASSMKGNPLPLSDEELAAILDAALKES